MASVRPRESGCRSDRGYAVRNCAPENVTAGKSAAVGAAVTDGPAVPPE